MMDDKDTEIRRLRKKIRKLEAVLKIVTNHSGKTENRMRKQFEVVSETMPVPMTISKENGEMLFANLNAQKTFGYSPEAFAKIRATALYRNPEDREQYLKILSDKGELNGFRTELKKSEGTIFPATLFSRKIHFDGQDCILNIVHDLTEVMALEKQLRQTQKMEAIGTLTSGIAHDFNNILATISGYAELAAALPDSEKENKKKEYLDNVLKAADQAKSMIRQMMDFCRQSEKKKKPFHLSTVVSEVVRLMASLVPEHIDIQADIRKKDLVIIGDPTQIHQMMTNLITNSVHAVSDRGGKIEVILDHADMTEKQRGEILIPRPESGTYARITVKDNGPGIAGQLLHSIFDPFFTTKPVGEGSGLGLAVVHGIIQGHDGAVSVESGSGKGAAFHCYFPVTEEAAAARGPDRKSEPVEKGHERILLADDNAMVLDVCSEILLSLGYHVTPCGESRTALDIFKKHPENFDLVITDNVMPGMSGTALSREILKIRPDIPIILITGTSLTEPSDFENTGIRTCLQKPFGRREIQSVIRDVLSADGATSSDAKSENALVFAANENESDSD